MTIKVCASLFVGGLILMIFSLVLLGPQSCEWLLPQESFEDKDVDFLISKLQSWRVRERDRAVRHLKDKTEQRDTVIAALTDTLLNDSHEEVRVYAAQAMGNMTPPAAEAVPELVEALHLPPEDRGKPIHWSLVLDVNPLPVEAIWALEEIGTPEALEAIEEFKKLEITLIESSVPDGASEVDADFINQNGITLRFGVNRKRYCRMLTADGTTIWQQPVSGNTVTFKPEPDDPKLASGSVYTLQVGASFHQHLYLKITITFTTKE